MMRFKIDENLHDDVALLFVDRGHDVHTVHSEGLVGCRDEVLAERCRGEQRCIVSLDLDFADIRSYPPADYEGIIVLRVSNQSRSHVLNVVNRVIDLLHREPLAKRLWIATDAGLRIRGE